MPFRRFSQKQPEPKDNDDGEWVLNAMITGKPKEDTDVTQELPIMAVQFKNQDFSGRVASLWFTQEEFKSGKAVNVVMFMANTLIPDKGQFITIFEWDANVNKWLVQVERQD